MTKWNFDVEMDTGVPGPHLESRRDEGMPTATAQEEIPTVPPLAPPLQPDSLGPENARTRNACKSTQDQSFLV